MKIPQTILILACCFVLILTGCGDPKKTATQQYWNELRGSFTNYNETVNLSLAKVQTASDPMSQLQDFVVESKNIVEACEKFEKFQSGLPALNVDEALAKQSNELAKFVQRTSQGVQKMQNVINEMYQLTLDLQNLTAPKQANSGESDDVRQKSLAEKLKRLQELPAEGEKAQLEALELIEANKKIPQEMEALRQALNKKYDLDLLPFLDESIMAPNAASVPPSAPSKDSSKATN